MLTQVARKTEDGWYHHVVMEMESAANIAESVRARRMSAVEVVKAHLARIEDVNPQLNAVVEVRGERALEDAAAVDRALTSGKQLPLAGVPVTIKSCIDVASMRCAAGSRSRREITASTDAPLVARLKRAGAVVVGNTNTPEMLMSYETDNALHGRTRHPLDPQFSPGGSSGGEAAAIASACSAGGVGSDGGGSIRVPASFCGIWGLKPTPGSISPEGHFPPSVGPFAQLGVVGPMARSCGDLRLLFEAMGDDAPFVAAGSTIGVRVIDDGRAQPEVRAAVRAAADALSNAGARVENFTADFAAEAEYLWCDVFCRCGAMLVQQAIAGHEDEISPMLWQFLEFVASLPPLSAGRLLNTLIARDELRARVLRDWPEDTVLLSPVSTIPAFRYGEGGWGTAYAADYLQTMRYAQWFNLLAMPALAAPMTRTAEGFPIGVQLAGRPYSEKVLFKVGALLEEIRRTAGQ